MARRLLSALLLLALSGGQLAAGACQAAGSHAAPAAHDDATSHDHASMAVSATSHDHASMAAHATSHDHASSHSAGTADDPAPVHMPCPTLSRCHWLALPSSTATVTAVALHTLASALPLADRASTDRADALTPPPRAHS